MKQLYFLLGFLTCISLGLLCTDGSAYQCTDISNNAKCSGVISGRTCLLKGTTCQFQTCEDLASASCTSIVLEGKQCFKNSASKCVGAASCSSYDSQESCKSFKNIKCVWDTSNPEQAKCRAATCSDIVTADECGQTAAGSTQCYFWGSQGKCDVATCENRSEDQCNGKTSNGNKCYLGSICRQMTCEDYKVKNLPKTTSDSTTSGSTTTEPPVNLEACQTDKFQLSETSMCLNQLDSTKKITCTLVKWCSDLKSQEACEAKDLVKGSCKWDISCRNQTCRDFSQSACPKEFGDGGCTWDATLGACISCGEITEGCACNQKKTCFWNYDQLRSESRCMLKKCSLLGTSDECKALSCYWNAETMLCGITAEDTGFTQSKIEDQTSEANQQTVKQNAGVRNMLGFIAIALALD